MLFYLRFKMQLEGILTVANLHRLGAQLGTAVGVVVMLETADLLDLAVDLQRTFPAEAQGFAAQRGQVPLRSQPNATGRASTFWINSSKLPSRALRPIWHSHTFGVPCERSSR